MQKYFKSWQATECHCWHRMSHYGATVQWKYLYIFFLPASRDSFSFLIEEVAWASIALILLIALTWKMVHWIKISSQIIRMPEQSLSVICTKIININDKSCILHHCKNAYKTNNICKLNLNFPPSDFKLILKVFWEFIIIISP